MIFGTPNIVTNGLILYLDAANRISYPGSGTTWADLSANVSSLTLTGTPTYSVDNQGILVFNGSTQYASIASYTDLIAAGNFSIDVWINPASIALAGTSNRRILNQYTAANNAITLALGSSSSTGNPLNTITTALRIAGTQYQYNYSPTIIAINNWYHIVLSLIHI